MTDEALHWDNAGGTGNLSNVPLHMADLGTDNYDQEFTLGLIENEQGTLELVDRGPEPNGKGYIRAMRGVRRADLQAASPGDPLRPALHRLCTEAGGWRMKTDGEVGLGRHLLFWSIALGGTAFDLVTKSLVFSRVGPARRVARPIVPNILELHTSHNTGALWGFGATIPGSSLIFAGLSVVAAVVILYYLFVLGAASQPGPHRRPGIDHGRCDGQLLRPAGASDTSATSCTSTSTRSASIARSSTSPTTCWSPARSRWSCTPCGPRNQDGSARSRRRRLAVGRADEALASRRSDFASIRSA